MGVPAQAIGEGASVLPRIGALVLALVCASPLVFAAMLTPDASGIGTHTQMGLPECGFKLATGYPCATCGCTTAFAHAAEGSLLTAIITQPFGGILALSLAVMALIAGWSAMSGMKLAPLGMVLGSRQFVLAWLVLMLVAWGYKAIAVAITS